MSYHRKYKQTDQTNRDFYLIKHIYIYRKFEMILNDYRPFTNCKQLFVNNICSFVRKHISKMKYVNDI